MVNLAITSRLRSTPFSAKLERFNFKSYTVYNHMLLPAVYCSLVDDYHHLKKAVQVWDVSCERQIEIQGEDAQRLIQMTTPRDLSKMEINQCYYAPMIDENAGMLNDPLIIKHSLNRFWVSIADSDIALWFKGIATALNLNVKILELPVYPLAVQGPLAQELMKRVFGEVVCDLKFFQAGWFSFADYQILISRSGYSKQGGFEIYVSHPEDVISYAENLWDALFILGKDLQVRPGGPNYIERIEAGLLSYGNDMTIANTPYECGLGIYCDPHIFDVCIGGKRLLQRQNESNPYQLFSLSIDGKPLFSCRDPWPIMHKNHRVGQVSSAVFSPDFKTNVALAMVQKQFETESLTVQTSDGLRKVMLKEKPFI